MAFPASPNIGDTHTEENTLWTYGSNGWYSTTIGENNSTKYTCGPSIGSLNDVDLDPAPTNGQALVYNSATDTWIPGAGGGGGGTPGGSTTQVQFNDAGAFGGDADLTWNKTTNVLGITGDVNLSDGGTYTTTLQTITPTAARTISFPDATGTVALVGGSSGQLLYNNAGANAGASTLTYDGSILTSSGRFINSYNAIASSPAKAFTGTWFTGGTATTTKPQVVIEPTGTTSTGWSTSGTGLGVNAASGFAGRLLDLQINGTSALSFTNSRIDFGSNISIARAGSEIIAADTSRFYTQSNIALAIGGYSTVVLHGESSQVLAQRNGTSAQTFRVYNTFTSSTNYELGKLEWSSNVFRIGTEAGGGGGTLRAMELNAGVYININLAGTNKFGIGGSSNISYQKLEFASDNLYDIGSPATTRPRHIYAGSSITGPHNLQGSAPASATATGTAGDIRYDASYIYICTATDTWKRAAITTWV